MGTISDLLEKLERVDLRGQTDLILENTSEEIIRLNQRQLYIGGTDADGIELSPYKWRAYAEYKAELNPAHPGIPDLYVEGNFFKGFEVEILGGSKFTLTSKDEKTRDLENKYGLIFGLIDDNANDYTSRVFIPAFFNYIENITGLKAE